MFFWNIQIHRKLNPNIFQLRSKMLSKIVTHFLRLQLLLGAKFHYLPYAWDSSSGKVTISGSHAKTIHIAVALFHLCYVLAQFTTINGTSSCSTPGTLVTATLMALPYLCVFLWETEYDLTSIQLMNTITHPKETRKSITQSCQLDL